MAITRADWFAPTDLESPSFTGGVQLGVTDLVALDRVQKLTVTGAPLSEVVGTKVAVAGPGHEVGERTTLTGPGGHPVDVEVVSHIDGGAFLREYLVDAATFDLQDGADDHRTWFIALEPRADRATVMDGVAAALPGARVQDVDA